MNQLEQVPANQPTLVWVDLETTGLDEREGEILEIAIVLTDLDLRTIDSEEWVIHYEHNEIEPLLDGFVTEMHDKSGLLSEVSQHERGESFDSWTREREWEEIGRWLASRLERVPARDCYLAGSSVHFDRKWLSHHQPDLLRMVSHRMLDVSSYKVGFPELFAAEDREVEHRAMADIRYSIEQHRKMRGLISQVGPAGCLG